MHRCAAVRTVSVCVPLKSTEAQGTRDLGVQHSPQSVRVASSTVMHKKTIGDCRP